MAINHEPDPDEEHTVDAEWSAVPKRNVPGYPPGFEEHYKVVWQELCGLSAKWQLYKDLYSTDKARQAIRGTAPGAFGLIESALRNDMIMSLGRLIDPPVSSGKRNISLEHLIKELKSHCTQTFIDDLEQRLKDIRTAAAPFKEHRNRKVGHTDLETALSGTPDPRLGVSRPMVDNVFTLVCEFMNTISLQLADCGNMFDRVAIHGTGEHLILYLEASIAHFEKQRLIALGKLREQYIDHD